MKLDIKEIISDKKPKKCGKHEFANRVRRVHTNAEGVRSQHGFSMTEKLTLVTL